MKHRDQNKQRIHEYFRTHGYEQTVQFGLKLGLAEQKIRRWMRRWRDEPLEGEVKQSKPG